MRRLRGRSRGQAMAELALVLPIFVLILFGVIDLSRFVYSNNSLSEVARESARQGSVAYRPADCNGLSRVVCIQTLAKNRLTAVAIDVGDVTVTCQRLTKTNTFINCPTIGEPTMLSRSRSPVTSTFSRP